MMESATLNASEIYHHAPISIHYQEYTWEMTRTEPFNELIVSWDAERPSEGTLIFFISTLKDQWSDWLPYAEWGADHQRTFDETTSDGEYRTFQDGYTVKNGQYGQGFRIKVVHSNGLYIKELRCIHVCAYRNEHLPFPSSHTTTKTTNIPLEGLSQTALDNPHHARLCSPTSVTAVLRYLKQSKKIDPSDFSKKVYDPFFDIYGNWIFNTAEASNMLGSNWSCWVQKINHFDEVCNYLKQDCPVIISIRSPLSGEAYPYKTGHIIVIKGFDPQTRKVFCMDPAFPTDGETLVSYDLDDLMAAWARRGFIAYIFSRSK
jgi:hypothetical protein